MNEAEAIDFGREAIFTLLKIGTPIMLTSLVTGVTIAIIQALTQIQEMTLTFVPKILVMFFVLMLLLPFIINELTVFMVTGAKVRATFHFRDSQGFRILIRSGHGRMFTRY